MFNKKKISENSFLSFCFIIILGNLIEVNYIMLGLFVFLIMLLDEFLLYLNYEWCLRWGCFKNTGGEVVNLVYSLIGIVVGILIIY